MNATANILSNLQGVDRYPRRVVRYVRLRELLVGIEGLALLRHLFSGDDGDAQARIDEVRRIVDHAGDATFGTGVQVPVFDVRAGYAAWSQTYERPGNPLISVEEPSVHRILASLQPARALDVACGTGRHTRRLVDLGHRVVGVDATAQMLARARAAVPAATFAQADICSLPFRAGDFDLVVCALALDHLPRLDEPVAELARVTRSGGCVVLSEIHPVLTQLGSAAYFQAADGASGVVRGHRHLLGDYLSAFSAAGLEVRQCVEPTFGATEVAMQAFGHWFVPDATSAAYLNLPAALVWKLVKG